MATELNGPCRIHGTLDATVVCRHVAAAVLGHRAFTPPLVRLTFYVDGKPDGFVDICQACARAWDFPPEGADLHDDEGLDRVTDLEWEDVCSVCLSESLGRHKA